MRAASVVNLKGRCPSSLYFQICTAGKGTKAKYDPKHPPEEIKRLKTEYEASKRKKSETFTQALRPGTWNIVYVNLPDIKPENFGQLTLSLTTNQVSLSKRQ